VGANVGDRLYVGHLVSVREVISQDFERWVTSLAAAQGVVRRRLLGGFAAVLGDKSKEWATQADLEHLPAYASDSSIALIASERQLDTLINEAPSSIAARAPFWLQLARFYGTGLGILLGLHYTGFDGATLVQQNGRALSLALPLPPFVLGQAWDPTPNLVVTSCPPLALPLTSSVTPGRVIPAGTPWFMFDSDTDFCSRFAVIFGGLPESLTTVGVATFTGTDTATATWNHIFPDTTYHMLAGAPLIGDDVGAVFVGADATTKTLSSVQVQASAAFTGTVTVLAWQNGAFPFADIHPSDLRRLRDVILKWKPAKATCVSISAVISGRLWGFPLDVKWGDGGTWGGTTVIPSEAF
jgi:hypothetical protein